MGDTSAGSPGMKPGLQIGDAVEVVGLQSENGKQFNGQRGYIGVFLEDQCRYEVQLSADRTVSCRSENLQRVAISPDAGDGSEAKKIPRVDLWWARGDVARIVGLHLDDSVPEAQQPLNSSLCKLVSPSFRGDAPYSLEKLSWIVEVQGKQQTVKAEHLRVCSREHDDGEGLMSLSLRHRVAVGAGLLVSMLMLLFAELSVQRLVSLRQQVRDGVPGIGLAILVFLAPVTAILWAVATMTGCYNLHEPLRDPDVTFIQISEMACGRRSAKVLYRIGMSATGALLAATVLIHQELALPHLPGGRNSDAGESFTQFGLITAAGVAVQGCFCLEANLSYQTGLHLLGTLAFFFGAWSHMGAAQRLYLPHQDLPPEEHPRWSEISQLVEAAAASKLLQHSWVQAIVFFRHSILMRAPMAVFLIPIFSQFADRAPVTKGSSKAASPATRSLMGLVQWMVVLNFALIFITYGPELSLAAMLPLPHDESAFDEAD